MTDGEDGPRCAGKHNPGKSHVLLPSLSIVTWACGEIQIEVAPDYLTLAEAREVAREIGKFLEGETAARRAFRQKQGSL